MLLNGAGAASLVLLTASMVMWAWLGRHNYGVTQVCGRTVVGFVTTSDDVAIYHLTMSAPFPNRTEFHRGDHPLPLPPRMTRVIVEDRWENVAFGLGASGMVMRFSGAPSAPPFRMSRTAESVPFWLIAATCAPLPLWLAMARRRAWTRAPSHGRPVRTVRIRPARHANDVP